jgi:hypothetical protein
MLQCCCVGAIGRNKDISLLLRSKGHGSFSLFLWWYCACTMYCCNVFVLVQYDCVIKLSLLLCNKDQSSFSLSLMVIAARTMHRKSLCWRRLLIEHMRNYFWRNRYLSCVCLCLYCELRQIAPSSIYWSLLQKKCAIFHAFKKTNNTSIYMPHLRCYLGWLIVLNNV